MTSLPLGLQHLKTQICVNAPVEVCYQAWLDFEKMPEFISRLRSVRVDESHSLTNAALASSLSADELQTKAQLHRQSLVPFGMIKHWFFSGSGGKMYEIENVTILEIPNHFYCTVSTDPDDLSVQCSIFFCPDGKNEHTFMEWEVSFWNSGKAGLGGTMTHMLTDIVDSGDDFFQKCLQDFKVHVEAKQALVPIKK